MTESNRREFLRLLGTGAVASAGLTGTTTAQATSTVKMGNNYFDPIGLHVEPGTTVRFAIAAGAHSATVYEERIPADATPFDSGTISSGSFEHTFETPGTYDYYCIPHKTVGMVGRIVVGQPGGPAEERPLSDGSVPESDTVIEQGTVPYGSSENAEQGRSDGGMMGHGGMGGSHGDGMWGTGMGGGGWLLGGLLTLLGVGGGAAYMLARRDESGPNSGSAMELLQERYERGEITETEYDERRAQLEAQDNSSE
ncbi:plastocyanin/azurin family copper-binding protein [Halolamina sp. C58]|uniref:plastocyanin/azurin family copper-binding protein n=1 Tax=Halolamina sp. C58 TaxID=3421640 RepID=UPI003EBB1568